MRRLRANRVGGTDPNHLAQLPEFGVELGDDLAQEVGFVSHARHLHAEVDELLSTYLLVHSPCPPSCLDACAGC